MENRNRNVFIVVAIVVVLACCLMAALAVALTTGAIGWFTNRSFGPDFNLDFEQVTEESEMSFEVGEAPVLQIENFAGNIDIQTGSAGTIDAVATRRAVRNANLQRIVVEPSQEGDTITIRTRRASDEFVNVAVDLDVTVPPGTRINVTTGAGEVTIDGVEGETAVRTGAGNVEVRGSEGQVSLDTGAGNIDYAGEPQGTSTFETGAGNIDIDLPGDFSGTVELDSGLGTVDVGTFDVIGDVSTGSARGTIGTGGGPTIQAHTGAGNINLVRR